MTEGDDRPRAGFVTFWTSLPGVLTGAAALIGAAAALVPLLVDGDGAPPAGTGASGLPPTSAPSGQGRACGLEGVPRQRIATVEAGTDDFHVVEAHEPKTGDVGLRLTNDGQPVGNLRFSYYADNELFKIEAVVDDRCRPVTDLENVGIGGDPRILQNFNTLRVRLGGRLYDLGFGASTTIRIDFLPYAT